MLVVILTIWRSSWRLPPEAALDGIHIIRTSVPALQTDAPDCVRNYKALANVERVFRSLKTIDLLVRQQRRSRLQRRLEGS